MPRISGGLSPPGAGSNLGRQHRRSSVILNLGAALQKLSVVFEPAAGERYRPAAGTNGSARGFKLVVCRSSNDDDEGRPCMEVGDPQDAEEDAQDDVEESRISGPPKSDISGPWTEAALGLS